MNNIQQIEDLISAGDLSSAISLLDREIESNPQLAVLWYLRGKAYWRMGKRANAISDYEEAAHLDGESPAVLALEMARSVMDFYNPDLLNP